MSAFETLTSPDRAPITVAGDTLVVRPGGQLRGTFAPPPDKSVAHRALMLSALVDGRVHLSGLPTSRDVAATVSCMRALGVRIQRHPDGSATVHGGGLDALAGGFVRLDCVRSGTTMRLLAGLLAGQDREFELVGDPQLTARPMQRVVDPIVALGAEIECTHGHAPIRGTGHRLTGGSLALQHASAQLSSAVLLAHLRATGPVQVTVPAPVRDHTERMLLALGAPVTTVGLTTTLHPTARLRAPGNRIDIPGDISAAAFVVAASAISPGSSVRIGPVGLNPGRTGFLDAIVDMRAGLTIRPAAQTNAGEPSGFLDVSGSSLVGIHMGEVARAIDELPLLAVLGCCASGLTEVTGAAELRVKETDRIAAIVAGLRAMGADIDATSDGFRVRGPCALSGARVDGCGDHRIVMALAVAGLVAEGETVVSGAGAIADSFPGFVEAVNSLATTANEKSTMVDSGPAE